VLGKARERFVPVTKEVKKFLDPKALSLISNYELIAKLIIDSFLIGRHRGPRHAFSLEYCNHREYYPGDPLKHVDWKYYGRTDRFFIKQYREETNLEAWLLVDVSGSMRYQGKRTEVSKLQYVKYLAAALTHLLLSQRDLVGSILFDNKLQRVIPPRSSYRQLLYIVQELTRVQGEGVSQFEDVAKLVASFIKKRSLIVLFSDLLSDPKRIKESLKHFLRKGNELVVFHVLTPEELEFSFRRFSFFEDLETHERVLLMPQLLKDEYRSHIQDYLKEIRKVCEGMNVNYQLIKTSEPFDLALAGFLKSREVMA
jgi:uncharacterized protein (DUF58 family)